MFQFPNAAEIERFRARHRRLCRDQQLAVAASSRVEDLDVDEGRTRKIPVKWREKQQQVRQWPVDQHDDGIWPQSAGTEMHLGFNAFDFSASPEGFCDAVEEMEDSKVLLPSFEIDDLQLEALYSEDSELAEENNMLSNPQSETSVLSTKSYHQLNIAQVEKQVTSMGFNNASLWEQKFPSLPQPGGFTRKLPLSGQSGRWEIPMHYATLDQQRRALYYRYYA